QKKEIVVGRDGRRLDGDFDSWRVLVDRCGTRARGSEVRCPAHGAGKNRLPKLSPAELSPSDVKLRVRRVIFRFRIAHFNHLLVRGLQLDRAAGLILSTKVGRETHRLSAIFCHVLAENGGIWCDSAQK